MKSLDRALTTIENTVIVTAFLGAFGLGVAQVLMRYVFKTGLVWSEQAVVALTILAAMIGGSRAVARNVHVRITLALDKLPHERRRYFDVFANVASILYCALMAYAGFLYVDFLHMTGIVSSESDFPLWIIYLTMPVAMILFIIRYFLDLPAAWNGTQNSEISIAE
jgi:C4-dicarboxylate transporter, DctQ subunit